MSDPTVQHPEPEEPTQEVEAQDAETQARQRASWGDLDRADVIGRLAADAEARYTPTGKLVIQFRIVVNKRGGEPQGRNVIVWEPSPSFADMLRKGTLVFVSGDLNERSWEDRESGQRRFRTEIIARPRDVRVLSPKQS